MRSYEAGLSFESNPKAYPEDIYLVAYEKTKHLAFSDPYFGALYQPINVKELQHLIGTADTDLPSSLRASLGDHEYAQWEVTDGFEEFGTKMRMQQSNY